MLNLSDGEIILQIQGNMFMQYFFGYSSFTNRPPFHVSLFVDILEGLSLDNLTSISELVVAHHSKRISFFKNIKKSFKIKK